MVLSAGSSIRTMWVTCEENVERLCSMLCSSPMSAKIRWKIASSEPSPAGTWSPAWAIRLSSPTVFSATVLPPVFGPVMTSTSNVAAKLDGQRDDLAPQQRVAGLEEAHDRLGRVAAGQRVEDRADGVHLVAEAPLGEVQVKLGQRLDAPVKLVAVDRDAVAQVAQDPLDLVPLLGFQAPDPVAGLDDRQRLDEQRLAARRLVVDDPLDPAALVGLDGQDVAAVPLGDDGVLQRGPHRVEQRL